MHATVLVELAQCTLLDEMIPRGKRISDATSPLHSTLQHEMNLRKTEKININHCNTERYYNSAVPFMQRQLNNFYREKEDKAIES